MSEDPKRVLIIDSTNLFIRHYCASPMMDADGEAVGGTVGFLRALRTLLADVKPDLCVCVWDGEGGSRRRRSLYKEYKAGRKPRINRSYDMGTAEDGLANMGRQRQRLGGYLDLLGIHQLSLDDVEADDVIAFVSGHLHADDLKTIVSTDRDFLQLVDARTSVYNPAKKKLYHEANFVGEMDVLPSNYILVKALAGDGSDNVKGIKGIGPKTAVKMFPFLATKPGSTLADVLAHAEASSKTKLPIWRKYVDVGVNASTLARNVELMQLTEPMMSAAAARKAREALSSDRRVREFEARLAMIRDGLQLEDRDLFGPFKLYQLRRDKKRET